MTKVIAFILFLAVLVYLLFEHVSQPKQSNKQTKGVY